VIIAGIDPGKGGAMVILYPDNTCIVLRVPLMTKGKTIPMWTEWASMWGGALGFGVDMIVIEQVGARPGQGSVSMFNFGRSLGFVHALASSVGVPVHWVTSPVWKGKMGLLKADKNASREEARRLLPKLSAELTRVKDDGVAEAALLALYGRRHLIA
jgi:crossover junction endodeoxyribonuclease RuvC